MLEILIFTSFHLGNESTLFYASLFSLKIPAPQFSSLTYLEILSGKEFLGCKFSPIQIANIIRKCVFLGLTVLRQ